MRYEYDMLAKESDELTEALTAAALVGWRLVSVVPSHNHPGIYLAIVERETDEKVQI